MSPLEFVAMGYRYPRPGSAERLAAALATQKRGEVARHMRHLVDAVTSLSLGEWEELHTATLDLSAPFVPYVGHVEWGENYRRGAFMAELQAAMKAERIDLDGELPDHIASILRYLSVATTPLGDLIDILPGAVAEMERTLRSAAPDNPYCHLLAATAACTAERPVTIGGRR